jgi:hypothetical protein
LYSGLASLRAAIDARTGPRVVRHDEIQLNVDRRRMPMTLSPYAIRWLTAAVFALTGVWLLLLAGGAVATSLGASITVQMWMASLFPGCAFAPALYYLRRRRRTQDLEKIRAYTGLAVILTLMGVVLFGTTIYNLIQMYPR